MVDTMDWSLIMDAEQAADLLGVSARRVKALCTRGLLDARTFSGVWIISRASVEARKADPPRAGRPKQKKDPSI